MEHEMGTEKGQQVDPAISDEEMNKQMMEKDKETKEGETPQE